jgi:NADH-quinone oxidoreductase subunit H
MLNSLIEFGIIFLKAVVVFSLCMGLASFCTWFERKGSALIQNRVGANRAGAYLYTDILVLKPVFFVLRCLGVLGVINTLLCDAVKGLTKEDFVPEGVSPFLHALAPVLAVLPIFLSFAVLPLAPDFTIAGMTIRPQLASLDAGILFILAMGSLAVYGVAMAGWTGNNKFSLLGGLRASAQMISYELAMGITLVTMIVTYGSLDLYQIVEAQKGFGWGINPLASASSLLAPISFFTLFIVGMAETKRGPFDLPESESELVAGYFTEYSGMKFLVFWLGEFAEIALFSFILALLFLGGWHLPFVEFPAGVWWGALAGHAILMGKVIFLCMLQIVIRWTLPRFRYDQLMYLGWKVLLPLSMFNLMVTAALKIYSLN